MCCERKATRVATYLDLALTTHVAGATKTGDLLRRMGGGDGCCEGGIRKRRRELRFAHLQRG